MRKVLQFDIGFGDVIVPKPQSMEYPTLLDMDRPVLIAYSKESIISEKFEAMLYLAETNSRMKDFYDIYNLCKNFDFDGRVLYEAVIQTLHRRGTPLSQAPIVFTEEFAKDKNKQIQWKAFIHRIKADDSIEFYEIIQIIRLFIQPIYECVLNEKEFFGQWKYDKQIWYRKIT